MFISQAKCPSRCISPSSLQRGNIPTVTQLGKARRRWSLMKDKQKITALWKWLNAVSAMPWYQLLKPEKCWQFYFTLTSFINQHTLSKHRHWKKKKDKRKKTRKIYLQSVAMPTKIHFLKRHSWHWFLVTLSITHFPSYLQE